MGTVRNGGITATITKLSDGFMLTLAYGSRVFRRRRHSTIVGANREMWGYMNAWDAA